MKIKTEDLYRSHKHQKVCQGHEALQAENHQAKNKLKEGKCGAKEEDLGIYSAF